MKFQKMFEDEEVSEKEKRIKQANPNLSDEDIKKLVHGIKTSGNRPTKDKSTDEEKDVKIKKIMQLNPKLTLADAKAFMNRK
jgi:hypothetical protein